jgi:hypothetical protein
MTQDPYGRPPGGGYVVRGEVVPDDEANVTPPTTPMTHFQKVASALRGDRTDPGRVPSDDRTPSDQGAETTVPDAADGEQDPDATRPEEVAAVRNPDAGTGDYWDDADETGPRKTAATSPGAPPQDGLRPGESDRALGDFSDLTYGSLLPDAAEFKARWQQVQFRFVDDPQGSVTEAADVIAQLTAKLEAAIQERQRAIAERQRALRERWSEGRSTDTESLRETLLMYRAFLDQLTGPR